MLFRSGDGPYSIPTEWVPMIKEFPTVNFIMAHFGVQTGGVYCFEPFQMAMDMPNVYCESGWCLQSRIVEFAKVLPKHKILFGSDTPPNEPGMWLRLLEVLCFEPPQGLNLDEDTLEDYLGKDGRPSGNAGRTFLEPEALKRHTMRLDALGFQVHFHALGDRAVRVALDAVEAARRVNGPTDTRPHLAHLQVVDPAEIRRFRPLGAIANIQTYWACNDGQMIDLTEPYLAPGRYRLQYPFRALLRAGVTVAAGSD